MPSAIIFGKMDSPKRALLVHGLSSAAVMWFNVAKGLAAQGYFVLCPDLLNHGFDATRTDDCRIVNIADTLYEEYFQDALGWDLLIGHSLGGPTVTLCLDRLRKEQRKLPSKVILIDPALEIKDPMKHADSLASELNLSALDWKANYVHWSLMDCLLKEVGSRLTTKHHVHRLFQCNQEWSYSALLTPALEATKVIILGSETGAVYRQEHADKLKDVKHVASYKVPGTTHSIQRDQPELIVELGTADRIPSHLQAMV